MAWKNVVSPFAIAPRRRVVATALMYGLSLTVRFTSAAGDETDIPAQAAHSAGAMTSIMINGGGQNFYRNWPLKQSIVFHRGPTPEKSCRAACDRSLPAPLAPDCSP